MNRNSFLRFSIGPIGAALLGLVSLPASTWLFDVSDIGRIGLLQTVISLSVILFSLGLDQSYVREYHNTDDRRSLFRTALAPGLLAIIAVGAFLLLTKPAIISRAIFQMDSWQAGATVVLVAVSAYCSRFFSLILRMEERGLAFSMSQVLPKAFFLLILLVLYFAQAERQFIHLLAAHATSILVATLIFAWNTRATWLPSTAATREGARLNQMLAYGAPLMVAGAASWGMEALDKVSLRILATFEDLGIYSIAVSIAGVASTLSMIFTTVWIPTAYRWASEPDCSGRIEAVGRKLTSLAATLIAATGSFSWLLGYVLPKEYEKVQYLVCICMLPPLLYAISEVAGIGTNIMRKSAPIMAGSLAACLVNLIGNYLLIPLIGVQGAAISTVIAFLVMMTIRIEASIRCWHPLSRRLIYGPVAGMIALCAAYSLTGHAYPVAWSAGWMILLVTVSYGYRDHLGEFFAQVIRGGRNDSGAGKI